MENFFSLHTLSAAHHFSLPGFSLIVVSSPEQVEKERAHCIRLFEKGLSILHLRKPAWSLDQLRKFIAALPVQYHDRLVLHQHYALAGEFGIRGIHLPERVWKDPCCRNLIRLHKGSLSASFHSWQAIEWHRRPYDYVFLSPVFNSISKKNHQASFELPELKNAIADLLSRRKKYVPRIMALGGVMPENVLQVKASGFSGAALVGAIWQSDDPVKAFVRFQEKLLSPPDR